jgi:hypothetical protein
MIKNGWYRLSIMSSGISSVTGFRGTSLAWLFEPMGFGISAVGRLVYISGVLVGKLIN